MAQRGKIEADCDQVGSQSDVCDLLTLPAGSPDSPAGPPTPTIVLQNPWVCPQTLPSDFFGLSSNPLGWPSFIIGFAKEVTGWSQDHLASLSYRYDLRAGPLNSPTGQTETVGWIF